MSFNLIQRIDEKSNISVSKQNKNKWKLALFITLPIIILILTFTIAAYLVRKQTLQNAIIKCQKSVIECKQYIEETVKENKKENLEKIKEVFSFVARIQNLSIEHDNKNKKNPIGDYVIEEKMLNEKLKQRIKKQKTEKQNELKNNITLIKNEINFSINQIIEQVDNDKDKKNIILRIKNTIDIIVKTFSTLDNSTEKDVKELCKALFEKNTHWFLEDSNNNIDDQTEERINKRFKDRMLYIERLTNSNNIKKNDVENAKQCIWTAFSTFFFTYDDKIL